MDVLTDVLETLELRGWLSSRTEQTQPWRLAFATSHDMMFHMLLKGSGYLSMEGEAQPKRLEDGDVLLFPQGHAHTLCDALTSPLTRTVHLHYETHRTYHQLQALSGNPELVLLSGALQLGGPEQFPFLHSLPTVIHIPGKQGRLAHGFANLVQLIERESNSSHAGTDVMLRRLSEMLFIQVIRVWVWIDEQAGGSVGWLAALRDPAIGKALGLIHQSPEHGWKVEELAEEVALSRAVFSARFTRLVGEPPATYLTRWRMHKATHLLKSGVKMEQIAEQLGYESEVAFRKAFRREVGIPPARYRKQA